MSNESLSDVEPINQDGAEVEEQKNLRPEDRSRLLQEWATYHDSDTPNLSDDEISRESIYGERG